MLMKNNHLRNKLAARWLAAFFMRSDFGDDEPALVTSANKAHFMLRRNNNILREVPSTILVDAWMKEN